MGAKELQPVRIMCELSETQLEQMASYVSGCLPNQTSEVGDIDELDLFFGYRLCVDFNVNSRNQLEIKSAEVLNNDWDVLETDSFALNQYLKPIINDYNARYEESIKQSRQIRKERKQPQYF